MTIYVLMYHFIEGERASVFDGLKGLSTETFRSQLSWLQRHLTHVDAGRLLDHVTGAEKIKADAFHLTFDDGTKDHIKQVLPILEEAGLDGTFFPVTEPLMNGTVPIVEKQRYLQYNAFDDYRAFLHSFADVVERIEDRKTAVMVEPTPDRLDAVSEYLAEFEFYTPEERLFRYVRNEILSREKFQRSVETLFSETWAGVQDKFVGEFYMDRADLQRLEAAGMTVGGHSHTHPNFSDLDAEQVDEEITRCLDSLEEILDHPVDMFAYPFGVSTESAVRALERRGVTCAFETDNRPFRADASCRRIPRIDAASFEIVKREVTA